MSGAREREHRILEIPVGPRLESVLRVAYRARRPVLMEGATGIGKSELVEQVARELGIGFVVLDLSLLEPPDLVGLPVIQDRRTTYAPPSLLPQSGAGILMLEELNRAERYIQQPALQLLTARTLHEYRLPEGWTTCAAINPEEGEYQVTPLDPAMRARFLHVKVRPDREAWLRWAREQEIHPAILQIASSHDRLFEQTPPRTWTYVSEILYALTAEELHDKVLVWDLLGGYLPPLWIEIVLAQDSLLSPDDAVDLKALLTSLHKDKALQEELRAWCDEGKTDRLQQLSLRVRALVEGPELGALQGQGAFVLDAFDALLPSLPGDMRESLQEAFGANPLAALYFSFDFESFLRNHRSSGLYSKIQEWKSKPAQYRHHWLACQTALCHFLEQHTSLSQLRRQNAAKRALGWALAQMNKEAIPLARTLQHLSLEPIAPR